MPKPTCTFKQLRQALNAANALPWQDYYLVTSTCMPQCLARTVKEAAICGPQGTHKREASAPQHKAPTTRSHYNAHQPEQKGPHKSRRRAGHPPTHPPTHPPAALAGAAGMGGRRALRNWTAIWSAAESRGRQRVTRSMQARASCWNPSLICRTAAASLTPADQQRGGARGSSRA